jgi:hypothetical protein
MSTLEKLHLDAIEKNSEWADKSKDRYSDAASKSAEITAQFAIEFHQWVEKECFSVVGTFSTKYRIGTLDKISIEYSIEELFQEFLKTK